MGYKIRPKYVTLYNEYLSEGDIRIRQAVSDKGHIIGIGWFSIKTKEELKDEKNKYYRKTKAITLDSGTFEEDKGHWQLQQYFNYKGKLIGSGYFMLREKEEYTQAKKDWARKHTLHIRKDGKTISIRGLNKRNYPNSCEICTKERTLVYHHWDDCDYNKGIWICGRCHLIVECMDKFISNDLTNIMKTYLTKKSQIEEEFKKK